MRIQDAKVRRPILSVGESTDADNMVVFDRCESVILPSGAPEIPKIRKLIKAAAKKMTMEKEKNTFKLRAWVERPDDAPFMGQGRE